jgi:hypothetical protein
MFDIAHFVCGFEIISSSQSSGLGNTINDYHDMHSTAPVGVGRVLFAFKCIWMM